MGNLEYLALWCKELALWAAVHKSEMVPLYLYASSQANNICKMLSLRSWADKGKGWYVAQPPQRHTMRFCSTLKRALPVLWQCFGIS